MNAGVLHVSAADVLWEAMGGVLPRERYRELLPAFSDALQRCDCTTVNRVAMFCAQVGHESVSLKYMSEIWGPTSDQLSYQGRMGNTAPGDGYRFRGSGPIQVTGRNNFTNLSRWAFANGLVPSPTFFVDNPDELRGDTYGFMGAIWYWTTQRPMNSYSDNMDIEGATYAINGGYNGLTDRRRRWENCLAMGSKLLTLVHAEDWSTVWFELTGENGNGL